MINSIKPPDIWLILFLSAGILSGSFFDNLPFRLHGSAGFLIPFLCIATALFYTLIDPKRYRLLTAFFIFLCLMLFLYGACTIKNRLDPVVQPDHILSFTGPKKQIITGKITGFAKQYDNRTRYVVECMSVQKADKSPAAVKGKLLLTVYGTPSKMPGISDIVRFRSKIKPFHNFSNPGGFDYKRFMHLQSIYAGAWSPAKKISIIDNGKPRTVFISVLRRIETHRNRFHDHIKERSHGSDEGKVLISLLNGEKHQLPDHVRDLFSKAGISHLLAISGLHLSIIAFFFYSGFYFLLQRSYRLLVTGTAKKAAGLLTLIPLGFYTVFTGMSESSQRAFIMISVVMLCYLFEKYKDLFSSICLAALVILVLDPAALFSISFQLSFAAVIFIMMGIKLRKKITWQPESQIVSKISMMIWVTFFATIGTAPLCAHYFNIVSVAGLAANLLMIPLYGLVILPAGMIAMACFAISPGFSGMIIDLLLILVHVSQMVCRIISGIPFSWFRTQTLSVAGVVLLYAFFITVALSIEKKAWKTFGLVISLGMLVLCGYPVYKTVLTHRQAQLLEITVLDVGQGSSTFIKMPGNKTMLIDGGGFSSWSSFDTGRYIVGPFLWHRGIKKLDYVVLTHPESDHLNGLVYILENFEVGMLIKNQDAVKSMPYQQLMRLCEKRCIPVYIPGKQGRTLETDACRIFFQVPDDTSSYRVNLNNNSLVMELVYNDFSMFFSGDVLKDREKELSFQQFSVGHFDVLLAPHHGSASSSSKVFLEKINPASVIISCGWDNRYGFPHPGVLKRYTDMGVRILRTDTHGAVTIRSNGMENQILTSRRD